MTLESAKAISANLNSLMCAILEKDQAGQMAAIVILRANLYADYYDVLPTVAGRKSWPPIAKGDTWDLNGKAVPYTDDEIDPDNDINF